MRPITLQTVISAPREEIFDALADLSRRPAWTDHFAEEYRLARGNPVGRGAAARFRARGEWVEIALAEVERPRRIVEEGRVGREGRTRVRAVYELAPEGPNATRVTLTAWTEPGHPLDRLKEALGARRWLKRQLRKAMARLRKVFEEPSAKPLAHATVAGFEPMKKARFGSRA